MDFFLKIVKLLIESGFIPLVDKITDLLSSLLSLITRVYNEKINKEKIESNKNTDEKIKEVCDNGTIEDILDLTQKIGENK